MIWPVATDQGEAKECKEEEEEDKHCHKEEWNVSATEIVNICIVQPHPFVVGYSR